MRAGLRALYLAVGLSLVLTGLALANGTDLVPAGACGSNEFTIGDSLVDDPTLAFDGCVGTDGSGQSLSIWAYQDPEQSGQELMDGLSDSIAAGFTDFTELSVAGTQVFAYSFAGVPATEYFFARGNTVYIVQAASQSALEGVIARVGAGGGGGGGGGTVANLSQAVPDPADISLDPVIVATSVAAAAGVAVAAPFPSTLFNSTLEANYEEVSGWFRRLRRRVSGAGSAIGARLGAFFATRRGQAAFVGIAAVMYGFMNPGFGLNLESLAVVIGSWFGIVALVAADQAPMRRAARRALGEPGELRVYMAGLLIGLGCVVVTRITDFQPGYLYGVVLTYTFSRALEPKQAGRAAALSSVASLTLAGAAFIGLGMVRAPFGDGVPLWVLPVTTALAVMVVGGIEDVLFGLLPLRYLPGQAIVAWSKPAWALLFGASAFAFLHVLVNPASGYLADTTLQPLGKVIALFVGFGLVSVLFWAFFRYRKPRMLDASTPDTENSDQ